MSGTSVALTPRAALATRVAELNDLVLFGDLADDELLALDGAVRELLAGTTSARPPWWESTEPDRSYRARSPFAGTENPRAPSLRIEAAAAGPPARAVGEATVDKAFAGPPGAVHGGIVCGLLDEVIGAAAGQVDPARVVVTGKLTVRFRAPTPLRTPLHLEAVVSRRTSRRIIVAASCTADDTTTATAEALMVLR